MSISFSEKDVELLLNGSPLLDKKGFVVTHSLVAKHPKSVEYHLSGTSKNGESFSFNYAKIEDVPLTKESILNIGAKGFYFARESQKDFKHTIFEIERPKTQFELALEKQKTVENPRKKDFFNILPESVIKEVFDYHNGVSSRKYTFDEYRIKLYEISFEYKLDPDSLRNFLFKLKDSIDKFKPSPSYVFSEVVRKGKKNNK